MQSGLIKIITCNANGGKNAMNVCITFVQRKSAV